MALTHTPRVHTITMIAMTTPTTKTRGRPHKLASPLAALPLLLLLRTATGVAANEPAIPAASGPQSRAVPVAPAVAATKACSITAFVVGADREGLPVHAAPDAMAKVLGTLPPHPAPVYGWPLETPDSVSISGVHHAKQRGASMAWFRMRYEGFREVDGKRQHYALDGWMRGRHLSARPAVMEANKARDWKSAVVMRVKDGRSLGQPELWHAARLEDCDEFSAKLKWREADLPADLVKELVIDAQALEPGAQRAPKRVWRGWVYSACHFPDDFNCSAPVPIAPELVRELMPVPVKPGN
jgi:hypothetical protein